MEATESEDKRPNFSAIQGGSGAPLPEHGFSKCGPRRAAASSGHEELWLLPLTFSARNSRAGSDNDAPGTTALEFKGRIYKGFALKSKFSFFSFFPFPMLPGNEDKNKA